MNQRNCPHCGEPMETTIENYRYTGCGLENVILENVKVRRCRKDAETIVSIPAIEDLHRVLAKTVASKATRLSPADIKFLRKHLGGSGARFAKWVGVDPATVSRWESGDQPIGPQAERLLRVFALTGQPEEQYEAVSHVTNETSTAAPIRLHWSDGGWATDAVA